MSYIENVAGFIFTVNIKPYLTDSLDTFTPSVSEENHPAVPRINGPRGCQELMPPLWRLLLTVWWVTCKPVSCWKPLSKPPSLLLLLTQWSRSNPSAGLMDFCSREDKDRTAKKKQQKKRQSCLL